MSRRYESPENVRRTNPYEYERYENIKERHYYGKYNQEEKDSSDYPETTAFALGKKTEEDGKEKYEFNDCDLKRKLRIKLAIKSLLMPSNN